MKALGFSRVRTVPWISVALIVLAGTTTAQAESLSGAPLVEELRHGGYVLVMRHAHSPSAVPSAGEAQPGNTHLERQLDDAGRTAARGMGDAIKSLHIPIGTLLSAPTYRALETARLVALREPKTVAELGDGGVSMQAVQSSQSNWLRQRVAQRASQGTNTFIVTHWPNISAAFGDDAEGVSDGETMIFLPQGKGDAKLVGRIKIDEWPNLAKQLAHG